MEDWLMRVSGIKAHFVKALEAAIVASRAIKPAAMRIILVMIGGSLGALARYGVTLMAGRLVGSRFPWGTLLVNLVGCFLIGVSFALVERTNLLSPSVRLFFMTGFLPADLIQARQ